MALKLIEVRYSMLIEDSPNWIRLSKIRDEDEMDYKLYFTLSLLVNLKCSIFSVKDMHMSIYTNNEGNF